MLPPRLLWRDPRPIPRLDNQDVVIEVVRDPSFHEPFETDDCGWFVRVCLTHDRAYDRGRCGEGEHLLASVCSEHGAENLEVHPLMHRFPTGFTPTLTPDQYAELEDDLYPEGRPPPAGRDTDTTTGRTEEWTATWHRAANTPRPTRGPGREPSGERVRLSTERDVRW
ncbi:hypothetical protein [Embleya hyalina]|uniref:Uncharacterized protein n=1 Tax=Embleya hyalina TaxID=516124 RepID=A0A401Z194_9ACTN|nr:hypothetical protein [Embleya hyalina]GCE00624.1 hypothetical protein EHYA_08350 [Embleya hyalina]